MGGNRWERLGVSNTPDRRIERRLTDVTHSVSDFLPHHVRGKSRSCIFYMLTRVIVCSLADLESCLPMLERTQRLYSLLPFYLPCSSVADFLPTDLQRDLQATSSTEYYRQ